MSDTIVVVTEVPVTVQVAGPQGPQGTAGQGVATGGTTGQVLKKRSGTDYDTEWGTGGGTVTYGTTAGTATEGNDARIATIGSATISTDQTGGGSGTAGNINTSTSGDGVGGYIDTSAINADGGYIDTHGENYAPGGNINTSNGGGSINTRGTGSIGLGNSGTRTTIVGAATADRSVSLPDASGTVALTQQATDYEVTDPTKGYILKSATKRWRLTIDDNGVLFRTALTLLLSAFLMCSSHAQVRDLVYGTNNVVIGPTNTNALAFTNSVAFSNPLTFGTNAAATRTNLGLGSLATNNSVASGAASTNSLLTADGAGGSSFVASRLSVAGLTTNVVRTSWANVGADKPTNDTGLSLTYAAGSVYKLRWSVFVSSTWSNVAYGIAFSSTNSFGVRNGYQVTPSSSTPSGATIAAGVTNTTLVSDSTSSYPTPVYVGGEIVFFSTNAGTLNFRFWTTASNTNTSTLFSNSIISLEKLYP
jgi:hypothetical protein